MNGDLQLGQKVKNKANRRGVIILIYPAIYSYTGTRTISSTKYVVLWDDNTTSEPLQKTELEAA